MLALVGFIEGYDLVMTGSLLVLAKAPLQLTDPDIRWLAVGPTFMLCLGGFASSAVSDHWVSGDADLLALNPFRDIPIVTPAVFVQGVSR